jgi:hypothetical protein
MLTQNILQQGGRVRQEKRVSRASLQNASGLLLLLLIACVMTLSACGGSGSNSGNPQQSLKVAGNWQFTVAPPADGSFLGGLQGGFLLQQGSSVSGAAVYAVSLPQLTFPCNSGSAPITGTISGQSVTLTAIAATQTFTFTGMLSSDGTTMTGTYASTAGRAPDGSPCGTAQTGLQWSALSVPPLTGPIQGSFHSTGGTSGLGNQDFLVTGGLTQGPNIGASNATVTGTLTFVNSLTNVSDYPCFAVASVNGQISGNSVILQLIGVDGSTVGQIGEPAGSFGSTGVNPVTFDSVHGGYILHGAQPTYFVATKACPGSLGSIVTAGDFGNICLALGTASACQQPITLSLAAIVFPGQPLGSAATTQTITLANNSGTTLNNMTVDFQNQYNNAFGGQSDFDGLPSFTETDACGLGGVPSNGQPFSLGSGASCAITVSFSPQESCPWIPFGNPPSISGAAPEWCPFAQTALVTVNSQVSADHDTNFTVPIQGFGQSSIVPSTSELDFGAEEQLNPPEASLPQIVSFTNNSGSALQILSSAPCTNPPKGQNTLPHPLLQSSLVAGLQVVSNGAGGILPITPAGTTITYNCDSDPVTTLPNFQISSDACTGTVLLPQASCSVQIAYVPQPNTNINSGLDYFLELNTVQYSGALTSGCEIDSGRFPVELKANTPSPLRMSPGAGLDFGIITAGKKSAPLTITLLNDPNVANPQTVTFVGKITAQGNYSETDDCPVTLVPGSSCNVSVTFKPGTVGFLPGSLTINYSPAPFNAPQFVYLRGTGQ